MKMSIEGLAELAGHEGLVLEPYRDSVNVWTIGIGHTAAAGDPDPSQMPKGVAITIDRAFELFKRDIGKYEAGVQLAIRYPLKQHEFDAAVSFHYNTGAISRATWVKTLNQGDVARAADQMMNWRKPPEITARRYAEMNLFREGVYTHRGMATIYPADENGKVLWSKGTRLNVLERLRDRSRQPDDPGVDAPPKWTWGTFWNQLRQWSGF